MWNLNLFTCINTVGWIDIDRYMKSIFKYIDWVKLKQNDGCVKLFAFYDDGHKCSILANFRVWIYILEAW
jgi:uncharacterized protein YraI